MKIAIIGAGFTGLSAAYCLSLKNHRITIFEKDKIPGGLAQTHKSPDWQWAIEKHYHHFFTSDKTAFDLIADLGLKDKILYPKTVTALYCQNQIHPFNSVFDVLAFSPLSLLDRLRMGTITAYLKLLPTSLSLSLEGSRACSWLERYYGQKAFRLLWQPLFEGKFGKFHQEVNMTWFWARIKKRTPVLAYLSGGYQILTDALIDKSKKYGAKIILSTPFTADLGKSFDKVIFTAPTDDFLKTYPQFPQDYKRKLTSIHHLHALNLLIATKEKFLKNVYWLNINEKNFPFIGVIQHTNLIPEKYYGGNHLTYIANYLPPNHPYLKMTKEELLKVYLPYLKKINSAFLILDSKLFYGPFAQPVFPVNYSQVKPDFQTPLSHIYLANMDMVYPWDRGVNYAIELGYKIAKIVHKSNNI